MSELTRRRFVRLVLWCDQPMVQFDNYNANHPMEDLEDVVHIGDGRRSTGFTPLAPAAGRHRLYGDDRQPAIRLDAVRQPHEQGAWLGNRRYPGGVQYLCRT